jgi:uncharacterized protein (PEP-CTERM system associated)
MADTATDTDTDMGRLERRLALGVVLPLVVCGPVLAQSTAGQHGLFFEPGVRGRVHISDNMLRDDQGNGSTGVITEVTPYVVGSYASGRTDASIDLSLRNIYRSVGSDHFDALRPNLTTRGSTALAGEWLWLEGMASIRDVNNSPFGALSVDPGLSNINRSRISTFSLSPYVIGRFSTFADYRVQYTFQTRRNSNSSALLSRDDNTLSTELKSGPQFGRWGWALNSSMQRRDFGSGFSLNRENVTARIYAVYGDELRFGGLATFDSISRLTNSDGNTSGLGPGLFADWSPNGRTTIRGQISRPYYGSTGSIELSHRTERMTYGLEYGRYLLTSNSASVAFLNPMMLLNGGLPTGMNPLAQQLANTGVIGNDGELISAGILSDALIMSRRLSATVGYSGQRLSGALSVYRNLRDSFIERQLGAGETVSISNSAARFNQRGLIVQSRYELNPLSSVGLTGRILYTENQTTTPVSARLTSVTATYQRRIDEKTSATLGLRRNVQNRSGAGVSYDENVLFGVLDTRF